jgi:acyl-CoA thioesterase-2
VTSPQTAAPRTLTEILTLEPVGDHSFRGAASDAGSMRVFGGQVAGQALIAAGRTVDTENVNTGKSVHSLHAYFIRPGDASEPIDYDVDVIRDGRSFSTRRVVALQNGKAIFNLSASFHVREPGVDYQRAELDAPGPDEIPPPAAMFEGADERILAWLEDLRSRFPVEVRFVDGMPGPAQSDDGAPDRRRMWLRASTPLGRDQLLHVCAAAYASDLFLLGAALAPHRLDFQRGEFMAASLDHAMWFHQPIRADEWMLYDQEPSWTGHGRGLAQGRIFNQSGVLLATVIQEGLVRVVRR